MKNIVINISLSVCSLLLTVVFLEIGARAYKNEWKFDNFLELRVDLFRSAYPSEFDKELGWIPREGNHRKNVWNTSVTILKDGIRSNGNDESIENGMIVLAVGDSFTFGDQVSNNETWPSRLEKISNSRVINGGVFGYGIDQSYLRMQTLASKYRPNIIIFSFIPGDIFRSGLSERTSVPKPYFELSGDDDLVLMKKHLLSYIPRESSIDNFRKIMAYSFFAHKMMSKSFPEYWLQGSGWRSTRVHSKGPQITCRIFERLEDFARKEDVQIYILAQYAKDGFEKDGGVVDEVIACIDKDVLEIVDMRASLAELKEYNISRYNSLFDGHMTREGNDFVATIMWEAITRRNRKYRKN